MRISDGAKYSMKRKILGDLYNATEDALHDRTKNIAKRNQAYCLEPYMDIINTLPIELIAHSRDYEVQVTYKLDPSTTS